MARSSAVKARSQATNQIKSLIVTGPAQLREQLRHRPTLKMIAARARLRPGHQLGDTEHATKTALRRLARRHQQPSEEITEADQELHQLVQQAAPVVLGRLCYDPRTRAYAKHRTHEGLSKPEIIRCLKRYVAREIFNALPTLVIENRSTHPLAKP